LLVDLKTFKVLVVGVLDVSLLDLILVTHLLQRLPFIQFLDGHLQVLQAQNEDRDVVEGSTGSGLPEHDLDTFSRGDVLIVVDGALAGALAHVLAFVVALSHMVHRKRVDSLLMSLFVNNFPDGLDALFIVELLENTITADHEEIEVGL